MKLTSRIAAVSFIFIFMSSLYLSNTAILPCYGKDCLIKISKISADNQYIMGKDYCYSFGWPRLNNNLESNVLNLIAQYAMRFSYGVYSTEFLIVNDMKYKIYIVNMHELNDYYWFDHGCGAKFKLENAKLTYLGEN